MEKITVQKMIDWLLSVRNPEAELVLHQRYGVDDCIEYDSQTYVIYIDDGTDYNEDDGVPDERVKDKVAIVFYNYGNTNKERNSQKRF